MDVPELTGRVVAWGLTLVLIGLIAIRLTMASYGIMGPAFRAVLGLIYLVMLLIIALGLRHVWTSRDVLRPNQ